MQSSQAAHQELYLVYFDSVWHGAARNISAPPDWDARPGGGYSIYPWVGRCGATPHTLTLFKTNIADFPTLFKTEFRFFNTLFKTFNPNIN